MVSVVFAPLGIVLGFVARGQVARTGQSGRGVANAAVLAGAIIMVVYMVSAWVAIISAASM